MIFKNYKHKEIFKKIYSDLKKSGYSTVFYEGNMIHVEAHVLDGASPYSSEVMRHDPNGSEYTVYVGEPCISDENYSIPLILHEFGHIMNNDMKAELTESIEYDRKTNLFSKVEYDAWKYAVSEIGVSNVLYAIKKLSLYSLKYHKNNPRPAIELYHYSKLLEKDYLNKEIAMSAGS